MNFWMVERCWLDGLVEYSFVVLVLLKSSQEAQSAQQLGSSALKNEYSYTQLKLRQLWNQCRGSSQQLRGATTSFFSALLLLLPKRRLSYGQRSRALSRRFSRSFGVAQVQLHPRGAGAAGAHDRDRGEHNVAAALELLQVASVAVAVCINQHLSSSKSRTSKLDRLLCHEWDQRLKSTSHLNYN